MVGSDSAYAQCGTNGSSEAWQTLMRDVSIVRDFARLFTQRHQCDEVVVLG